MVREYPEGIHSLAQVDFLTRKVFCHNALHNFPVAIGASNPSLEEPSLAGFEKLPSLLFASEVLDVPVPRRATEPVTTD